MKKLISIFKTPIIEFLTTEQFYDVLERPVPSGKMIPDWYKTLPTHIKNSRDIKGGPGMTAKKCIPMLEAVTHGFMIPLGGDVHVRTNEDASLIDITENQFVKQTEEHHQDQVGPSFPFKNKHLVKFINHFVIKTAPGYSCLFVPPINHIETRFITLGGIVDTDKYDREINFPSVWLEPNYDDFLYAGTPIVQCIPFKRDTTITKHSVRPFSPEEFKKREITRMKQDNENSYYTKKVRVK